MNCSASRQGEVMVICRVVNYQFYTAKPSHPSYFFHQIKTIRMVIIMMVTVDPRNITPSNQYQKRVIVCFSFPNNLKGVLGFSGIVLKVTINE